MLPWLLFGVVPAVPLFVVCINLLSWKRGFLAKCRPRVSVLIPARNEARNIQKCIFALQATQASDECIEEIVVYDDLSTDGTGALVDELAQADPRVSLLKGVGLPDGWVGKPHACQQLLERSRGDVLLFVDADVRMRSGGLLRLLSFLEEPTQARVLTAVPRQICGTFYERLVLPLLLLTYTSWLPLRLVEHGRSDATVAANGQLVMLRRKDALALGGFSGVRAELVDDVAFARLAKKRGYRLAFVDGFHIAHCRMYRSAKEVWNGFSKNVYEGVGASPFRLALVIGLYVGCFVAPYVGLGVALGVRGLPRQLLVACALGVCVNVVLRTLLALRYRQPAEGILLHPVSVLALVAIAVNSARWAILQRNHWAGRIYSGRARRTHRRSGRTVHGAT